MNAIKLNNILRIFSNEKKRVKFISFIVISVVVSFYIIIFVSYIKTTANPAGREDAETASKHTTRKLKLSKLCGGSDHSSTSIYNRSLVREDWDFKLFKRPQFLRSFKNPCFFQNVTVNNPMAHGAGNTQLRLRCLPYFLVVGFPKSGTTDLWVRLRNHPDMKLIHAKEPKFFNRGRYRDGSFGNAAAKYVSIYDMSAVELHRLVAPLECEQHPFPYYYGITGEASADTVFANRQWQLFPGNELCAEPVVTNADYVHHINPDAKIIFLVRNPVERLYSDYLYEARYIHYPVSSQLFHEAVIAAINVQNECRQHASFRKCAYNNTIETFKIRLRVGMYHIFISDWLEVFPRKNILVVNSENTNGPKIAETYKKILKFLNIRPFTRLEEDTIFQGRPTNARSAKEKNVGDMLSETRILVEKFYEPFNKELTNMFPDINYGKVEPA